MAQQLINIGTANTGNGENLRASFDKTNDNFTELYSIHGWGYYQDGETSPATQSITTTASYLQIDGLGSNSNSDFLPSEILGTDELWDTTNDKITPIGVGDSYSVRIDLEITGKTGSPTLIDLTLDIGGTGAITIPIVQRILPTSKTPPYKISLAFPIFCLTTFNTNGGRIFLATDTGTVTIGARGVSLFRMSKGS